MRRLLLTTVLAMLIAAPASASSFLVNDSFETGDFTGWVTGDLASPFFPLSVQATGAANTFGWPWSSTATDGNFVAFTGFDGAGPGTIFIAQDVLVPLDATTISFDWRAAWDLSSFGATLDRLLDFNVQPFGGGANLQSTNILTATAGTIISDSGNMTSTIDISAFAGQSVRFAWDMTIPENFSGPAQLQIDNIDTTPVPEPASLTLLGLGLAGIGARRWRQRKAS
jgi:PEP-CTERM motif